MPVSGSEDFDRSFEFFAKQHDGDLFDSCVDDFADNGKGKRSLNSTFDTAAFEFSVENSSFLLDLPDVSNSSVARFASFNNPVEFNEIIPVVNILIQEQVSAVYDDFSQEGSVAVSGSILVRSDDAKRFSLVVNDAEHSIQRVEALGANEHVQDVTGGRELLVNLEDCKGSEDVSIANYFCVPKLRPVPLLVKSRVSSVKGFARVGFKIRANPSNKHSISNAVVLLAVPPDVDGENCKMSRKGGSWDELKRAMSWYVDFLHPGEAIEIQAQFPVINANESEKGRQFPLLVRCDFPTLFSNLTLTVNDQSSFRINMNSVERILHRKV